jgi:hypothetical protein
MTSSTASEVNEFLQQTFAEVEVQRRITNDLSGYASERLANVLAFLSDLEAAIPSYFPKAQLLNAGKPQSLGGVVRYSRVFKPNQNHDGLQLTLDVQADGKNVKIAFDKQAEPLISIDDPAELKKVIMKVIGAALRKA